MRGLRSCARSWRLGATTKGARVFHSKGRKCRPAQAALLGHRHRIRRAGRVPTWAPGALLPAVAVALAMSAVAALAAWLLTRRMRTAERAALRDGLTGLPNRKLLDDRVEQALARSRRTGESFALMVIDLDGFKGINDAWVTRRATSCCGRSPGGSSRSSGRATPSLASVATSSWSLTRDAGGRRGRGARRPAAQGAPPAVPRRQ